MKIISEIKNIYKHFCMGEDNEGRVCCNQDFSFWYSNVYVGHMTEFVFEDCVTISNVFNTNVPVKAFFQQ